LFSRCEGTDRSARFTGRLEIYGDLLRQADRLSALLGAEGVTLFDRREAELPKSVGDPIGALCEVKGNALVHREYRSVTATRVSASEDRTAAASSGGAPGADSESLRAGRAAARWRRRALVCSLSRRQRAQVEGQGISMTPRMFAESGRRPLLLEGDANRARSVRPVKPRRLSLRRPPGSVPGRGDIPAALRLGSA